MRFDIKKLLQNNRNVQRFAQGDVIIREGNPMGNQMYIILTGTVGVYKLSGESKPVLLAQIGPDSVLGEMSLFLNRNQTATAIALTEVVALVLARENAYQFFEKEPEATYMLIKILCERIEDLSNRYADARYIPLSPTPAPAAASAAPTRTAPPAASSAAPARTAPPAAPVSQSKNASPAELVQSAAAQTAAQSTLAMPQGLFLPGHKSYTLPEMEEDKSLLSNSQYNCPICQHSFEAAHVRDVKLRLVETDLDLRKHYADIEPIYYLTLTCPKCFFSAIRAQFNKTTSFNKKELLEMLSRCRQEMYLEFPVKPDAQSVFSGMYLTLACTPFCSRKAVSICGFLWLNISWVYRDCGDEDMERQAMEKACEYYERAYREVRMDKNVEQQVCLIIGQLKAKLGDYGGARKYLFEAKTNKMGSRVLSDMAEDIIEFVRKQNAE